MFHEFFKRWKYVCAATEGWNSNPKKQEVLRYFCAFLATNVFWNRNCFIRSLCLWTKNLAFHTSLLAHSSWLPETYPSIRMLESVGISAWHTMFHYFWSFSSSFNFVLLNEYDIGSFRFITLVKKIFDGCFSVCSVRKAPMLKLMARQ